MPHIIPKKIISDAAWENYNLHIGELFIYSCENIRLVASSMEELEDMKRKYMGK